MANVGVLGAGSWGTALSVLLTENGHQVTVWSIDENEVNMLNEKREHVQKLPGVKLPDSMVVTTDLEGTVKGKDFLVLAVPSPFTRSTAKKMAPFVAEGQIIVDVAKGIESNLKVNDQQNIDNAASNLKFAYEQLEIRTADYTQVNEVLKLVPSNLEEYTTASREALETAIATVKNDLDMTNQDIVNGYVEMISAAINGLAKQNQTVEEGIKPWIVYLIITLLVCFIIALIVIMVINSRKIKPVFVKNEFTTNLLKNEKENKKVSDEFSQNPFAKPTQKSIKENAQKAQSQPNTQINRTINNQAQSSQSYKPQNNINSQANTQQTQTPNNPMNSNQKPNKK